VGSRSLAGVRVIDLAEVWAGPYGASLLGDLGADVVKVESFPRRSLTRPLVPDARVADGSGPVYERVTAQIQGNRNKRNVAIDLRSPAGGEAFRRLLATADVLIDGYAAGAIDRLGFGWEVVHAVNPRLTMISMPAWGVRGPYRRYVALGSGVEATTGHSLARGWGLSIESIPSTVATDASAPLGVVFASLTALQRRESSGEGSFVDLSHAEGFAWYLAGQLGEWSLNARTPEPAGNREPHCVPHGCYRAAGEGPMGAAHWVAIAAETDAQWAGLARVLGHREWSEDGHPWASIVGRLSARAAIDERIAAWTSTRDRLDAADELQAAGVIAAPVVEPSAMLPSPQLQARGWFQPVEQRYLGTRLLPGFLWQMQPDHPEYERPSALVGEHNREVMAELGYSAAEIERLYDTNAIGDQYSAATDALLVAE
jgi:crotonobetainyl-CoA:carnitine CoA-transferase CaiB-like acyl-CoA transferase